MKDPEVQQILQDSQMQTMLKQVQNDSKFAAQAMHSVLVLAVTFSMCLRLRLRTAFFEVKVTAGYSHLGGEDFDNRTVTHFVLGLKRKHNKDVSGKARSLCRLRTQRKRAKCQVSAAIKATTAFDSLCEGIDFFSPVNCAKFGAPCMDLFRGMLEPIENVLCDPKNPES